MALKAPYWRILQCLRKIPLELVQLCGAPRIPPPYPFYAVVGQFLERRVRIFLGAESPPPPLLLLPSPSQEKFPLLPLSGFFSPPRTWAGWVGWAGGGGWGALSDGGAKFRKSASAGLAAGGNKSIEALSARRRYTWKVVRKAFFPKRAFPCWPPRKRRKRAELLGPTYVSHLPSRSNS